MFYQYNNLTGRITYSTNIQSPLFPIRPLPLQRADPPKITYDYSVKPVKVQLSQVRHQSQKMIPGTNVPYSPLDPKLKAKMELFQKPNDIPVHLKGGPADVMLYRLTMGVCIAGVIYSYYFIFWKLDKRQ